MAGQRSFFYGVGLTTDVPGLFIAAPVCEGSTVIGVVVVKVSLDALETSWARARDPVLLFDARGIAFLSAVPGWRYRTRRLLGIADQQSLDDHAQYSLGGRSGPQKQFGALPWTVESKAVIRTRLDGQTRRLLMLDQPLPAFGWTLTVMADLAEVTQARNEAMALAALGLGVGLKIWRSIAEAHGGSLQFSARPGGGTIFSFTLPHEPTQPSAEHLCRRCRRGGAPRVGDAAGPIAARPRPAPIA